MGKLCGNNEKSGILSNLLDKTIGGEGEKKIIKLTPIQMETLKNMRESIYEDVSREAYQKTCSVIGVPYMDVAAEMIENTFQENGINPHVYNETLEKYGLDEIPFTDKDRLLYEVNMKEFRENCPEMAKMYDDIREINSYCSERYERMYGFDSVDEIEADLEELYPGMGKKYNDAQIDNFFEGDGVIFKESGNIRKQLFEDEGIQSFEDKGVDPYDYTMDMKYDMIQEKEDKPFTMDMKYDMDNKPSEATLLKASEGASAIADITAAAAGIGMVAQNNTIEKTIEKVADEMVETATQDIDFEPYC